MPVDLGYFAAYALTVGSVGAVFFAVILYARRTSTSLSPSRLTGLTVDELRRSMTGDAVFLMHLSIAAGVGLSIIGALLDPALGYAPPLRLLLLVVSVPAMAGLVAAFAWRVQRYAESKSVEHKVLHSDSKFTSKSSVMQVVLALGIGLTTTELALSWVPGTYYLATAVGIVRNGLVVAYYARPTVNLIGSFDRPLSAMRVPFNLGDVMAGKVDPESIKVGASKVSELQPYEQLSFDSCVEVGACEAACPATAAGRPLSPRALVRKLSLAKSAPGGLDFDVMGVIGEDELWSCTSCGACVSSCPVSVKHLDIVYDLRRELVSRGKLDKEKSAMLENLGRTQNPYGFPQETRADWAEGLGIDTIAQNPSAEYVYWVGCISSFDQRAQGVAKALAKILKHAGVSFAIMAGEEACNGDPARRLGEEGRFQELALQNIERLNSRGVKKIISACPHCFNTLKNEYPAFGGKYEVVYHTQLISDLIRAGKVRLSGEKQKEIAVTLHDACYAARYNSVFEEPREALESAGVELREMHRRKEKTFCCGAGGSNYWFKVPQQTSIAGIRTEEARKTGASRIATECPYCLSMFEDSAKAGDTGMSVRDVAEIVAESLA